MYTVDFIELGCGTRPKGMFTYLGHFGEEVSCRFGVFLLRDENSNILIDSGIDAKEYARNSAQPFAETKSLEEGLASFSVRISQIDAVILTHLHFDHAALLPKFKDIPVYVQRSELKYALNPYPIHRNMYNPACFEDAPLHLLDGKAIVSPGIQVIPVPGHTPGCQAVLVDTGYGKTAISGFCSIAENFADAEGNIRPFPPAIHIDIADAYSSMMNLLTEADSIYPMHEPAAIATKRKI